METKHNHTHSHGGHSHTHSNNKKALTISFILITSYMLVEFIGGWLTNSLALLSDAGHMLSDSMALGLSLSAIIFGAKKATETKTFGYKRYEILAALLNGFVLVVISIFIFKEAIHRLYNPEVVIGKGMMIISTIGLIINIIVAKMLHAKGDTEDNLNVRSAYLHVLGDLLGSVGAIVAALLIILFDWHIADPIASMIVSVLVLYSGWSILRDSVNVLMEAKPSDVSYQKITDILNKLKGVKSVHDLHIWMITNELVSMTVHLCVEEDADRDRIVEEANQQIYNAYGISHITIQTEGRDICNCTGPCKLE